MEDMNLKFNKKALGLLSGIFLTMTVSNAAVAETDPVNEKASMAAFEQLVVEIENGQIQNEEEGNKRFDELVIEKESNPNTRVKRSASIAGALGKSAEMQACLRSIGAYKCGQARLNVNAAINMAKAYYPSSTHNGKGDAFRHSYWNALMCKSIGCSNAKIVADNHERYNPGPQKEHDMDYYNNQKGRDMYQWRVHNGWSVSPQAMADNLRQDIRNGLLKYISYQYDSVNGSLWWTNQ